MSQTPRVKRPQPAPRKSPLPAIISALVVIGVFVGLGFILANNSATSNTAVGVPTLPTFDQATPDALAGAPTTAPAVEPTVGAATDAASGAGSVTGADSASTASRADKYSAPPPMTIDAKKNYTATITTPRGDIVVKLRPDLAPETVNSFVFLTKEGYYDGLTWHRVIEGFMAQGGDPTGTGAGGPGYNVPDEFTDQVAFDRPGLLAMAKTSAPDSAGSQFFITTAAAPHLSGQYTIFGEVTQGQELVNAIPLRDPQTASTPGEQIVKVTVNEG